MQNNICNVKETTKESFFETIFVKKHPRYIVICIFKKEQITEAGKSYNMPSIRQMLLRQQ